MSEFDPQPAIFDYHQQSFDFQPLIYSPTSQLCACSPPSPTPFYQVCEFAYAPVSMPTITPPLVQLAPVDSHYSFYSTPAPSPVLSLDCARSSLEQGEIMRSYYPNSIKRERRSIQGTINELPAERWKSMTDKDREEFLKAKRRQEAYKTAICQNFQRNGECRYGLGCRFAHGPEELRLPKYNHPKYKTALCRSFAVSGFCPYSSRCQFIHEKYKGTIPEDYATSVQNEMAEMCELQRQRNNEYVEETHEVENASQEIHETRQITEASVSHSM